MAESKSKEVLGGKKKDEPTIRELRRMSLEHTTSGHIKATHEYNDGEPEIHAVDHGSFLGHLGEAFNLTGEKKAIDAKRSNVEAYEKEHGSMTKPAAAPAPEAPGVYDRIRARLKEKAAQPPSSVPSLLERADALTKGR